MIKFKWCRVHNIVFYLSNSKTAGRDSIYNLFIKKCTDLHPFLYTCIREIVINEQAPVSWFYKGRTYLIPKGMPTRGSNFRSITCMLNLYKLTKNCTTRVLQLFVGREVF